MRRKQVGLLVSPPFWRQVPRYFELVMEDERIISIMNEKRVNIFFFMLIGDIYFLQLWKTINVCVHNCWRANKHFDFRFRRIRSVHFLSRDGKDASYEGSNGLKKCWLPAKVGIFCLMFKNESTFPHLYLDLACKQFCFPPRKRYT